MFPMISSSWQCRSSPTGCWANRFFRQASSAQPRRSFATSSTVPAFPLEAVRKLGPCKLDLRRFLEDSIGSRRPKEKIAPRCRRNRSFLRVVEGMSPALGPSEHFSLTRRGILVYRRGGRAPLGQGWYQQVNLILLVATLAAGPILTSWIGSRTFSEVGLSVDSPGA